MGLDMHITVGSVGRRAETRHSERAQRGGESIGQRRRRRGRVLVVSLLAVSALAVLAGPAEASVYGNARRDRLPQNGAGYTVIKVCISRGSTAEQKRGDLVHAANPSLGEVINHMRLALSDSWEVRTSVRFRGWIPCDDVPVVEYPRWVGLFIHPDAENHSHGDNQKTGTRSVGISSSNDHNVEIQPWGPGFATCIRYNASTARNEYHFECAEQYAIHELGHTLGFAHEWQHYARPSDCTGTGSEVAIAREQAQDTYDQALRGGDQLRNYTVISPTYDYDSIMTYNGPPDNCADVDGYRFGSENLSSTDRAAVEHIFAAPLTGRYDVGVPRGGADCPGDDLVVFMDDEDNDNTSSSSGWTGASFVDRNTRLEFCRLDGAQFGRFLPRSDDRPRSGDYAVLKLGEECPPGSLWYIRRFDNEDDDNTNWMSGARGPNTHIYEGRSVTELHFCYFRPDNDGGFVMKRFPAASVGHGVFAADPYGWGQAQGWIRTDDEDTRNANELLAPPHADPAAHGGFGAIVESGHNTTLHLAQVAFLNEEPVAATDDFTTNEDARLDVPAPGVLANDADAEDTLTASLSTNARHGTVALRADGSFTYTPNRDFAGTDTFTYRASDGFAQSTSATVTITVNPVNDTPVAVPDTFTTDEDAVLTIAAAGVLANDSDADGDTLTPSLEYGPEHGTLALRADGSFTYTPNRDFAGIDSFTYRADDRLAQSAAATVTITVNAVNDAPVPVPDSFTTDEDVPLRVPTPGILANDTDVDGDALTAKLDSGPQRGVVTLDADGSFTYTPNRDFAGIDSFTYRAEDGLAQSAGATVTITVNAVNDAPVAGRDSFTTDEDTPLQVPPAGVLANDTDVDGDTLTATLTSDPAHGTVTLRPDGSFTYTPARDFAGTDAFTYRVSDGVVDSAPTTVNLVVNPVNDTPVVDAVNGPVDPLQVATEAWLAASFADPDADDAHTCIFSWGDGTSSSVIATGRLCSASRVYAAAGVYTVTVTVTDADGASHSGRFEYVVVYDPEAGFVTGGGWFLSPQGAYSLRPDAEGRATFGFVSQYKNGAKTPTGNTSFRLTDAAFTFESSSYQWLVVSGARAQYRGTGRVNGVPGFSFLITATDGQLRGGDGVDKFRLKVWDTVTGTVLYDNVRGASDDLDGANPQAIRAGQITIHPG